MIIKEIMSENIHYIQVPGNRQSALELMREKNVSGLPVVKKGTMNLIGIVTRSDLVNNPDEEQLALIMTRNLLTTTPDDDIKVATQIMIEKDIRRVPVIKGKELVGIVTVSDVIEQVLSKLNIEKPVKDYMITNIPTTWERTPLNVAFEIMRYSGFKVLLALNKEGDLSGILTETDFINESEIVPERSVHNTSVGTDGDKWSWDSTNVLYVIKNHLKFSDKNVKDVAATDLVLATTRTTVTECANKMIHHNIEQVPVTDVEGELTGLVRITDLIKAIKD